MPRTVYFVSYFLHNKDNDGWAYKVVNKYNDLSAAKKAYHTELANYIDTEVYDSVTVSLTDSFGNVIMYENDIKGVPEVIPEVEPEEE